MRRIKSFSVNHMTLMPGVYVSREDNVSPSDAFDEIGSAIKSHDDFGERELYPVTTYDIRITRPNFEPVMGTGEIHTMEHLGATYLRNREDLKYRVVYWGPMGCRTGFYLIMTGFIPVEKMKKLMIELFEFIADFEGAIPGATPEECGNYSDMDLPAAKERAAKYVKILEAFEPRQYDEL